MKPVNKLVAVLVIILVLAAWNARAEARGRGGRGRHSGAQRGHKARRAPAARPRVQYKLGGMDKRYVHGDWCMDARVF